MRNTPGARRQYDPGFPEEPDDEPTTAPHPLAHDPEPAPLAVGREYIERLPAPLLVEEQASGATETKKDPPQYLTRSALDVSDKVVWGGSAALVVAGLLSWAESATGVPAPEGLDQYIVALVGIVVAYLKTDRV